MHIKIPTANISNEEWLSMRKTGIGGSDAGAVCGLNPYGSAMSVFRDKTSDEVNLLENEAVRQGRDLEEYVAKRFTDATGLKVRCSNYMYRSVEHPFMIADVDRLIVGEDAGLECKTVNAYNADKWENGNIPLHYAMQCYHYMAVTGRRAWHIAAVILGRDFVYRKLVWDDAVIGQLIKAEEDFWKNYVEKGAMPPPDGSRACDEVLEQYFHISRKGSEIELAGFDKKLSRREEILADIAKLQEEQKRIEQEVKLCMKDNEIGVSGGYRVTWGSVETTRLDSKRIKEERPEIYKDYAKTTSARRFRVRAA